ncbi:hypothetical protein DKL61_09770 [Gammaproteobacteria bacterium ESL0073]|nr:hypothetical protein DKL61_09770 [Gammaproteobacteria bacterium ESL0073]
MFRDYAYRQKGLSDDKAINDWIISVVKQASEELLLEWSFRWLNDTPRACYYVWLYTINSDQLGNEQSPSKQTLSTVSASHEERYNTIISFFDCSPAETRYKIQDLERLKKS